MSNTTRVSNGIILHKKLNIDKQNMQFSIIINGFSVYFNSHTLNKNIYTKQTFQVEVLASAMFCYQLMWVMGNLSWSWMSCSFSWMLKSKGIWTNCHILQSRKWGAENQNYFSLGHLRVFLRSVTLKIGVNSWLCGIFAILSPLLQVKMLDLIIPEVSLREK